MGDHQNERLKQDGLAKEEMKLVLVFEQKSVVMEYGQRQLEMTKTLLAGTAEVVLELSKLDANADMKFLQSDGELLSLQFLIQL